MRRNFYLGIVLLSVASAQAAEPFQVFEVALTGRLRNLTLEKAFSTGTQAVTLERRGIYPHWTTRLSAWSFIPETGLSRQSEVSLPPDALFYGFARSDKGGEPMLVMIRPGTLEVWKRAGATWILNPKGTAKIDPPFPVAQAGDVTAYAPVVSVSGRDHILAPTSTGAALFSFSEESLKKTHDFTLPPRAFYASSYDIRPLELPFWVRGSIWYPKPYLGTLTGGAPTGLFWSWMDEVIMTPFDPTLPAKTHYFFRLSEADRDDGRSHVVTESHDFNGDGRTDFLVNKFEGATTSLRADTSIYITQPNGEITGSPLKLKPKGDRTAGAIAVDLDRDGKKDLAVASTRFTAWSVVRALLRKTVEVSFALYRNHAEGFKLERPDLERDLSFRFSLFDAEIEGVLPSMDGDFNGDGLPDVVYSPDRKEIIVLLGKKPPKEIFPSSPSASFKTAVLRDWRIGDVNGDGRSDIVMFDPRSAGNRKFSVLLSTDALK